MPGYTPDEVQLLTRFAKANDATQSMGEGFNIPLIMNVFARIVTLRDFAAQQAAINRDLQDRVSQLEIRLGNKLSDDNTVYLRIIPDNVV